MVIELESTSIFPTTNKQPNLIIMAKANDLPKLQSNFLFISQLTRYNILWDDNQVVFSK